MVKICQKLKIGNGKKKDTICRTNSVFCLLKWSGPEHCRARVREREVNETKNGCLKKEGVKRIVLRLTFIL